MGKVDQQQAESVSQRLHVYRAELVDRIGWAMPQDGLSQPLTGVHLARISCPTKKVHSVLAPSLCVIAQGSKIVFMGDSHYQYDPAHYLLTTLELPRVSQVLEASKQSPYLSFRLELDPHLVGSVLVEIGHAPLSGGHSEVRAIHVSPLEVELLDAIVRFVRLINCPNDARILMPLITKEIIYRLLMSQHGKRLLYLTLAKSNTPTIAKAIEKLRQNFDQPIQMERLAHELGMSVSSVHHHFKAVTAMLAATACESSPSAAGPITSAASGSTHGPRFKITTYVLLT